MELRLLFAVALVVLLAGPASAQAQQINCTPSCRIVCYSYDPLDGSTSANPINQVGELNNNRKEIIKRVISVGLNSFLVTWDDGNISYYGFPPSVTCRAHSNANAHKERQ